MSFEKLVNWAKKNPREWWGMEELFKNPGYKKLTQPLLTSILETGDIEKKHRKMLWTFGNMRETHLRRDEDTNTTPLKGSAQMLNIFITKARPKSGGLEVLFGTLQGWFGASLLLKEEDIALVENRVNDLFTIRGEVLTRNSSEWAVSMSVEKIYALEQ